MRPFDFVCVFYSVVLGVAVAQLMIGVGRLFEERERVRTYWLHSIWILNLLLVDVDNWWSTWALRDLKSWNVFTFLLLIGLVAVVYLMTVLLFPRMSDSSAVLDLRRHYDHSARILLRANAAAWLFALFCNWSLFPISAWFDWGIVVPGAVVLVSIVAAQTERRSLHAFCAISVLVAISFLLFGTGWRLE